MPSRIRYAGLVILTAAILGPLFGAMLGLPGAVVVLILVAVLGFSTVVLVMMIGLMEMEFPHTAEESAAVQAWIKRLNEEAHEANQPVAKESSES